MPGPDEGSVVMVMMQLKDKDTGKSFTWRWLGIVVKSDGVRFTAIRFGVPDGHAISKISKRPKDEHNLIIHDPKLEVSVLAEESWTDSIHAFKMQLLLAGRLDDLDH